MNDYKKVIDEKIVNLTAILLEYKELVKLEPSLNYRLDAIENEINVLNEILAFDSSVNIWIECLEEDSDLSNYCYDDD